MELIYRELSSAGIRTANEDALGFFQPATPEEWNARGAICIICDGVSGQANADMASQLAVREAMRIYNEAEPGTPPVALLKAMFNTANIAIYDANVEAKHGEGGMATTMTACLYRNHEVIIGHVGDCRVFHIRGNEISCITTDHSYTGMQMKLGLLSAQEAAASDLRCVLTRSVGKDPMVQVDFYTIEINPGDYIVQCCDGVYTCMSEQELRQLATGPVDTACQDILKLCERREGDDNQSIQVVCVKRVERVTYFRGLPVYQTVVDPTMEHDLKIDQILDHRYQIIDQISRSGMATIYRAIDQKTGTAVALKVPHFEFESDPGFYSRFEREEQIGQRLRHPYILRIEPTDDHKSRPYIVMEYLKGQTLGQLMKSVIPLPEADSLKIASRVCDALQYMHENDVVHRDLKPDNIMICDDGSIRIMDFGIAKVQGARRLTFGKFQPAMGTPDYMSPEQVKGARGAATSDIYSMGAMLYEMVTGYPPFEGSNPLVVMNSRLTGDPVAPRSRNPAISPAAEEIILHAMARKPEERYQTATELRHDLDYPYEVQITGRAERLTPVQPFQTGMWRHRHLLIGFGIVILVAVIFLICTKLKFQVSVK